MKCKILLALSGFLTLSACFTGIATKASSAIFYDATPSIDREDDVELAQQASLGFLKMLEGFYFQNPKDKKILFLLTRAYAGYAYGFTENQILANTQDEEQLKLSLQRAKRFYGRAKTYGIALLSQKSSFKKGMTQGVDDFTKSLKAFGKADVPAMFWTGFAWASHLNFNKDSPEAVIELPKVEALMKRVIELDPEFYYGGPYTFFGAFYGSRPKMLGGDPDLSKEYFEKALAVTEGKHLMSKVAYAQFYAVQTQNLSLFKKLLGEVLTADPLELSEQALSNRLAKRRARLLLKRSADFFENAN